jgi:hypothetical protein
MVKFAFCSVIKLAVTSFSFYEQVKCDLIFHPPVVSNAGITRRCSMTRRLVTELRYQQIYSKFPLGLIDEIIREISLHLSNRQNCCYLHFCD